MIPKISGWHVGVAAEAYAAGLFARCGLDVSVQYGANQPGYDLIVAQGDYMMKVSVKGSQDGAWALTQSYLKNADYHAAVTTWMARHTLRTVFCFVQFKNVPFNAMPRIYLATVEEVAQRLRETANGRGDSILYESHDWGSRAYAAGTREEIPTDWLFSPDRVLTLLKFCS